MQINKSQFVEELAANLSITHTDGERFVNKFIALIYKHTSEGNEVSLSGFAKFTTRHCKPRIGVNPRKPSEKIAIPELITPKVKAGEAWKNAVRIKPLSPQ